MWYANLVLLQVVSEIMALASYFSTPKSSILKKSQTESFKKVHFKPLSTNFVRPYYGLETYMFNKQASPPKVSIKNNKKLVSTESKSKPEPAKPESSTPPKIVEQVQEEQEGDEFEVEEILDHTKVLGFSE